MPRRPLPRKAPRVFWITIPVLLFAGIVCFHEIDNFDAWLNLRAGGYILDEGEAPKADVFSHTRPGTPWVYHEWLSAAALELVRRLSGTTGLVLFTALVAMVSFGLMLRLARGAGGTVLGGFLVVVGMMAASGRFTVRCHLFTLLFFAVFLFILEKNRLRRTRALLIVPLLQAVWANLHGGFALGIALLGAYLVAGLVVRGIGKLRDHAGRGELEKGYLASLAVILVLSAAATLLNPYGIDVALKPFVEFGTEKLGGGINEWAPPLLYTAFPPRLVVFYKIALVLAAGAILAQLVAPKPAHLIILVALGILSLTARRHIAVFSLALVPFATVAYLDAFRNLRALWRGKREDAEEVQREEAGRLSTGQVIARFLLLVVVASLAFQFVTSRAYRRDHMPTLWGSKPCPLVQPVAALDFLEKKGVVGTIFNNYSVGGYIAYRLYPEHKIFVDGRNVMYADFLPEYDAILMRPAQAFPEAEEKYGIGTVILRHTSPGVLGLVSYLKGRDDFSLAYYDEVAAIFLRGEHETVRGVAEEGDGIDRRYPTGHLALGQFHRAMGDLESALAEFHKATERGYPVPEAHHGLAALYEQTRRLADAEKEARRALELKPDWLELHLMLAKILLTKDPPYTAEAEEHLLAALEIQPDDIETRLQYAVLLASTSEPDRAEKIMRELVAEEPESPSLAFSLAQLLEGRQKRTEAKAGYRRVLELAPDHFFSHYALAAMLFQEQDFDRALPHAEAAHRIRKGPKTSRLLKEIRRKLSRAEAPGA